VRLRINNPVAAIAAVTIWLFAVLMCYGCSEAPMGPAEVREAPPTLDYHVSPYTGDGVLPDTQTIYVRSETAPWSWDVEIREPGGSWHNTGTARAPMTKGWAIVYTSYDISATVTIANATDTLRFSWTPTGG
jgi:hypothetical protein